MSNKFSVSASIALMLSLSLTACQKKASPESASSDAGLTNGTLGLTVLHAPPVDTSPLPPPFTGKLTADRFAAAKDVAKMMEPWDRGLAKVVGQLGTPTKTEGTKVYWAVAGEGGRTCTSMRLEQMTVIGGPPAVSTLTGPTANTMPSNLAFESLSQWRALGECLDLVGAKLPLPPDAPGAAGPKAIVSPEELKTGLDKAPSKWLGKKIKLKGFLGSTSTMTVNGEAAATTVAISSSAKSGGVIMGCKLAQGVEAPKATTGTPIAFEGTVHDPRERLSVSGDLVDCRIAK